MDFYFDTRLDYIDKNNLCTSLNITIGELNNKVREYYNYMDEGDINNYYANLIMMTKAKIQVLNDLLNYIKGEDK